MTPLLRSHPALLVWIVLAIIGAAVCASVGLLMKRAGLSLRPLAWFAGFLLLIGGPQFLAHLHFARSEARTDAARAESLKLVAPAGGDSSAAPRIADPRGIFGPDVDPDLIRDVRTSFGDVFAPAETAQFASLPGGETVLIAQFRNAGDAERAWVSYLRSTGLTALAKGDSDRGFAVSRPVGDRLFLLPMGRTIGVWTGIDDQTIRNRMLSGGFEIPRKAPLAGSTNESAARGREGASSAPAPRPGLAVIALLVAGWIFVVILFFFKGAAWAGSSPAGTGVAPVPATQLRSQLEAVNALDVPFRVEAGSRDGEIVATWKYADAKWVDHARAHGLKRIHRLVIALDERRHVARVRDFAASHDWSIGGGRAAIDWRFSTGVTFFQHEHSRVFGLQLDDHGNLQPQLSYEYTFNLEELKQPLRLAVTRAGWTWRPVVWEGPAWLRWLTE